MYLNPPILIVQADSLRKKKKRKGAHSGQGSQQAGNDEGLDVSVFDVNEPTYCKCKRVSFGNMIACENTDCAIEWFHFECVGLTVEPTDPWFCPACREPGIKPTDVNDESGKVKIEPDADSSQSGGRHNDAIPNDTAEA